jgi:small subunit ribosomal protein S6
MMRTYETIFIVEPSLVGEEYTAVVDKFKGVLTDQGANILKIDEWGTRKLAYMVKKQNRGTYVLAAYEAPPQAIKEFERRMRIDESIIKFQTVHLEKGLEPVAEVKDVAAAAADLDSDEE